MALTKTSYSMLTGACINVKDYGAVGDGTTDDTAAFNLAIAALTAPTPNSAFGGPISNPAGGTILIPNGTYKITSTLTVNTGITLKGYTVNNRGIGENLYYGAVFYNAVSSGPCVLLYRGAASIEGVMFVGLNASSPMGECVRCISEYNRVRYCTFSGGTNANVITITNQDTNVDPTGVEIDNNTFTQFNSSDPYSCIYISGATASTAYITNNQFNLNTAGANGYIGVRCIKTDQTYTPTLFISGNNFFNAYYATTGSTPYPLVDLKVTGSIIQNNSFGPSNPVEPTDHYGLSLSGSNNFVVSNSFGTYGGINVIAGSSLIEIGPNYFTGVTTQVNIPSGSSNIDNFGQQDVSFTPTLTFGGAAVGMTGTFVGKYSKIRNVVTAEYYIQLSALGSSTGDVSILLPVAANSFSDSVAVSSVDYNNMLSIGNGIVCNVSQASTVGFLSTGSATTTARLTNSNFTNSSTLKFSITYLTD